MKLRTLQAVLADISLGELYLQPHWNTEPAFRRVPQTGRSFECLDHCGWLISLTYLERDLDRTDSTAPEPQTTRTWIVPVDATETDIVRTAWKLVMTSLEHRLGEHFKYRGTRVYNPHIEVASLAAAVTPPLKAGDLVLTVQVQNPSSGWEPGARTNCRWGAAGVVLRESRDHGLCYEVVHGDHTRAWYDRAELVPA